MGLNALQPDKSHIRSTAEPQTLNPRPWAEGAFDYHLKNGSSQGQNLALAVLYVPSSLDSGTPGAKPQTLGREGAFSLLLLYYSEA